MKLIIDIPENVVIAIQNGKDYRYDIHTTIAQGIPYEERPHGEWLHPYEINIAYECSNCGIQMPITDYFNFCPNCGAEMEVSNDG